MIYADEIFYLEAYSLDRNPVIGTGFLYYARQASQIIDQYTFGRLKKMPAAGMPEVVRMCCCELAEEEYRQEKQRQAADGKTSEKIGTYSVSYSSRQEAAVSVAQARRNIVMKWLAGTGLCYQGV